MSLITAVRDHLSDLAYSAKEKQIKYALITEIKDDMSLYSSANTQYRKKIFDFYTRRHFLSLNLMRIIKAVQKENNPSLNQLIGSIVGDFSYIPNANSYCKPMIRLNIQSDSILRPESEFVSSAVDIEINNKRIERKITRCYTVIKKLNVSKSLTHLAFIINATPDVSPDQ